jgi:hypothetical protein
MIISFLTNILRKATGDNVEEWTNEKRFLYSIIRQKFMIAFRELFAEHSKFDFRFTKAHDPEHEDLQIEAFGSLCNLDEMNFEGHHKILKGDTKMSNKLNLEEDLMKKVGILCMYFTFQNQMADIQRIAFPEHAEFYNSFMEKKDEDKLEVNAFKGSKPKEIWHKDDLQTAEVNTVLHTWS